MLHLPTRSPALTRLSRSAAATLACGLIAAGTVNLSSAGAATSALPRLPSRSVPGALKIDRVIVPVTRGAGSRVLKAFTARRTTVYVQISCSGPSGLKVPGMLSVASCKAKPSVSGYSFSVPRAWAYHPRVMAAKKTRWEIVITERPAKR